MSLQSGVFLQTSEEVHFSPLPIPSLPPSPSNPPFPLPRHWGREAERCPCLPPLTAAPPCASPDHPLPEAMEICGAGAVLVLAEAGSQDGSRGHASYHRLWSALGFAGCFCAFWSVMGPSFQGPWLLPGRDRSREDTGLAACSSSWQNVKVLLSISRRIQAQNLIFWK